MTVVQKLFTLPGIKQPLKRVVNLILKRKKSQKILFYSKKHLQHAERNNFIAERIQLKSWVLDIGSNTGETSNLIASRGSFCLGLEVMKGESQLAQQNAYPGAAFMLTKIDENIIREMPKWDVILMLSVAHRIYAFDGEQKMISVIRGCSEKANNIFFEASTRHARYTDQGQPAPSFEDLNVEECDEWHRTIFQTACGSDWEIVEKKVFNQSQKEPFRITYHLRKKQPYQIIEEGGFNHEPKQLFAHETLDGFKSEVQRCMGFLTTLGG